MEPTFTDQEINELADWLNGLSYAQLFFLRSCWYGFILEQAALPENGYHH